METPDFDEWVAQRGAALLRFAYLLTRDHARAEEAVQDALIAAYSRWTRICRGQDPEAYVRRSIVNADISRWRRFLRRETPTPEPASRSTIHTANSDNRAGKQSAAPAQALLNSQPW